MRKAISRDFRTSGYFEFKHCWCDHCLEWARVFQKEFYLELCETLRKEFDIY